MPRRASLLGRTVPQPKPRATGILDSRGNGASAADTERSSARVRLLALMMSSRFDICAAEAELAIQLLDNRDPSDDRRG